MQISWQQVYYGNGSIKIPRSNIAHLYFFFFFFSYLTKSCQTSQIDLTFLSNFVCQVRDVAMATFLDRRVWPIFEFFCFY